MKKMSIIINNIEYEIIKELGKGGFGNVHKVLSKSDNQHYAIKVIPIKGETKEKIESFRNEANILSKFECNNIIKYYDSNMDNNNCYILMELCDGENLRSFIDNNKSNNTLIEENKLKKIIIQICIGIKEIHNKKIIHRDLKPENIFMNENMDIKIGDFGISKQLDLYKTHTLTIKKAGSDYYIAPEIKYKGIYNEKSDIWSLGCIIYELFTLNVYSIDKSFDELKKIDSDIYNYKWQELIDSLLKADFKKRFDINQVNEFLKNKLNINYKENNQLEKIEKKIKNMNINSEISNKSLYKNNLIIGEIYIYKEDINKKILIINSFENYINEGFSWRNKEEYWKFENEKEIKENIEMKKMGKKSNLLIIINLMKRENIKLNIHSGII